MSGVLTGAQFARHLNTLENPSAVQNLGHVSMAYRTDLFLPPGEFNSRIDEILRMRKFADPAPCVERVEFAAEGGTANAESGWSPKWCSNSRRSAWRQA